MLHERGEMLLQVRRKSTHANLDFNIVAKTIQAVHQLTLGEGGEVAAHHVLTLWVARSPAMRGAPDLKVGEHDDANLLAMRLE